MKGERGLLATSSKKICGMNVIDTLIATEGFTVHNLSDFACCLISTLMALLS